MTEINNAWSCQDSELLYQVKGWGGNYFAVNSDGNVCVTPFSDQRASIDVHEVVTTLKGRGVGLPLLIRFQDVIAGRVKELNQAFSKAIKGADYPQRYISVYPIKVNQLHEVVEEILDVGKPYQVGLECGSKSELVAMLAHLEDDDTLLVCNGYKDKAMLQQIVDGQRLGKNIIPIFEKYDEFEMWLKTTDGVNARLQFGVRVRLSSSGAGRWAQSSGDVSKFGMSVPELVRLIKKLENDPRRDAFVLLHFHLGSQISNILTLSGAVKEITHIYAQLIERNVPLKYLDVGGGLGVNYEVQYADDNESINYSMQEYANTVIYSIKEICDLKNIEAPIVMSESGRALTAHHSVLIIEVLNAYKKDGIDSDIDLIENHHDLVKKLHATFSWIKENDELSGIELLEAYHDAKETRQQADALFSLGYLEIEEKALVEQLYWSVCRLAYKKSTGHERIKHEFYDLEMALTDQYLCDFSVFQSMLDHWAIGQRFPIMPIHRLQEYPSQRGSLVDLTCDSDGKVAGYVSSDEEGRFMPLHEPEVGKPYYLGIFLMGAYQDIMGDAHNLFGRVAEAHVYVDDEEPNGYYIEKVIPGTQVDEILSSVQYFPKDLEKRMNRIVREKVSAGKIRPAQGVMLLESYVDFIEIVNLS